MVFVADTHVHIYPCHNLQRILEGAYVSLSALAHGLPGVAQYGLFLAERADCAFFRQLSEKGASLVPQGFSVEFIEQGLSVCISRGERRLLIFPGRQVVSKEKIELLSLLSSAEIPDGKPLHESIMRVIGEGGLPLLCWAPGKWTFERGRIVRKMLEDPSLQPLFLGDSMLRAWPIPEPAMFQLRREYGRKLLAGSDPLPFRGEEELVGRYAVRIEEELRMEAPCATLKELLRREAQVLEIVGSRCTLFHAGCRFIRNELQRRIRHCDQS